MNFALLPEQSELRDSVRKFCEKEYDFSSRHKILISKNGISARMWSRFAELGWLGAGLAEDQGGYGGGALENMLILEQFGRALVLEPFLSSVVIASEALAAHADAPQRETWLAPLIDGTQIAVLAHNEPGRAQDNPVAMTAKPSGNGIKLNGRKSFILGGPSADLILVTAMDDDGVIGLFAVEPDTPGVQRIDYHAVDGRRVADYVLNDVRLGAEARIGAADALPAVERALDHGVIGLCAEALGAMEVALATTRDYISTRKQFGVTLSTFQALQHRMADMHVEAVLARSMLYRGIAALAIQNPQDRQREVSAVKAFISEAGMFIGAQSIQLHGGIGITEEYTVGHYFKRLVLARNLFGSADTHLTRFLRLSTKDTKIR